MKEEVTYICEICGKRSKNPKTMKNHENICRECYESCQLLELRLHALFAMCRRQGFKLAIQVDDRYGNEFVAVSKEPPPHLG
mgnify:CR=1 FL=1